MLHYVEIHRVEINRVKPNFTEVMKTKCEKAGLNYVKFNKFLKKNIRRNPEEIKSLCVNHGLLIFAIKASSLMKRQKGLRVCLIYFIEMQFMQYVEMFIRIEVL